MENNERPKIEAYDKVGLSRDGQLTGITGRQIVEILGFEANCEDDPDKVGWSWGFKVDGVHCGVWSYYGSGAHGRWSYYGPKEVIEKVFGKYVSY